MFFVITDVGEYERCSCIYHSLLKLYRNLSAKFKAALKHLKITTTGDVIRAQDAISKVKAEAPGTLIPLSQLNIAFSQKGVSALGIKDSIGDLAFAAGQLSDAQFLGDEGHVDNAGTFEPNWETAFKGQIHGVLLFAGESWTTVNNAVKEVLDSLGKSIRVVYTLKGSVRPGAEKVSQPTRLFK